MAFMCRLELCLSSLLMFVDRCSMQTKVGLIGSTVMEIGINIGSRIDRHARDSMSVSQHPMLTGLKKRFNVGYPLTSKVPKQFSYHCMPTTKGIECGFRFRLLSIINTYK